MTRSCRRINNMCISLCVSVLPWSIMPVVVTCQTLIEQKLGIRTWKTIIKEKLSLVQRSYFQR